MGGQYYPTSQVRAIIGSKDSTDARTTIALTTSYQAESGDTKPTKTFETSGFVKLNLSILYTMGATETTNSIEMIIEGSPDRTNFYRIPNDSTSGATSTLTEREFTYVGTTNAGDSEIGVGLDIFYKYMRVSVKESEVVSNAGSVYVEYTLLGY